MERGQEPEMCAKKSSSSNASSLNLHGGCCSEQVGLVLFTF